MIMYRIFGIVLGIAEQEIGKVIARIQAVEAEVSLGGCEDVLNFLVQRPTGAVLRPGVLQVDGGYAVVHIRPAEDSIEIEPRGRGQWRAETGLRKDVDAIAVIVEGYLVQQGGADGMRKVNNTAVRRITESVSDGRQIVAAPLGGAVRLRDL